MIRGRFNGVAESGGKTWRKKIGRPVAVHATVMVAVMWNIVVLWR